VTQVTAAGSDTHTYDPDASSSTGSRFVWKWGCGKIDCFYRTGRKEEIEATLRGWLVNTIERLKQSDETPSRKEQAA
jgi:hypothetical protein